MIVLVTAAVGLLAVVAVARLAAARQDMTLARGALVQARNAMATRDDAAAKEALDRAARLMTSARRSAKSFPLVLTRPVPLLGSPSRGTADAAAAGLDVVAAGRALLAASASFPTSASSGIDGHDLAPFHGAAVRSEQAVVEAEGHLDSARAALEGPSGAVLGLVSGPARTIVEEVDAVRTQLDGARRGLGLLAELSGPDAEVRLLILSQDSLELRPTGGYIGSYGVISFSHGTVRMEKFAATEDLPPADPPMKAPAQLALSLPGSWGLSNANWWPDFPTSAATARELFRRQGGGEVDGVFALTELATARLVGVLGPLKLPSYAEPVVEKGFEERAVFEVELKRPLDEPRKKFLVELSDVLFARMFDLPADRLPALADAIGRSVGAGDIQLWFDDPERQRRLDGAVIAGRLPRTADDFLMVVDANLKASKANLHLTKTMDYRVRRTDEGASAHLEVRVRNDGEASVINPYYDGLVRVYAPAGARLVGKVGGQQEMAAADGPYQTFVEAYRVEPKAEVVLTFDYALPASVLARSVYRLTWVRQAGTPRDELAATAFGKAADLGANPRVLATEQELDTGGFGSWLRRRWVVRALGLS